MNKTHYLLLLITFFMFSCIGAQSTKNNNKIVSANNVKSDIVKVSKKITKLSSTTNSGKVIKVELERIKFPYDNKFLLKWYVDWDINWYRIKYLVLSLKISIDNESYTVPSGLRCVWIDPSRIWIEIIKDDNYIVYIEGGDGAMSYKEGLLFKGNCLEELHYFNSFNGDEKSITKIGCF